MIRDAVGFNKDHVARVQKRRPDHEIVVATLGAIFSRRGLTGRDVAL